MKNLLKNKIALIASIVVVVVLLVAGGTYFYYSSNLKSVSATKEEVVFVVESGETPSQVVQRLQDKKLIKNASVTKLYSKLHGLNDIKAGNFVIDKAWDSKKILQVLNDAKLAKGDEVNITFKEGMWAKDVAALLETKMGLPKADTLALWNDDAYLKELMKTYPFLDESILNTNYKVKLEGYLFPETYIFKANATAKEITTTFLDHFQSIYKKYEDDIKKNKLDVHQLVTLASVVQYEASAKKDMDMIAGVFYNRLKIDMPLQSSVTVCYALYENLTSSDDCEVKTDVSSPYNTYVNKGLPIGPILNPGEEAIHAVLNPKDNDYIYFVADINGDGKVYYAKTLDEQEANIDKFNLRK